MTVQRVRLNVVMVRFQRGGLGAVIANFTLAHNLSKIRIEDLVMILDGRLLQSLPSGPQT